FVVLVGLASKNAILIVEFARERHLREGHPAFDAAVEAATVRLRPIVMTSLAFILGVLPLGLAHGAGAEMRQTLGVAVFAGVLGGPVLAMSLARVFYSVLRRRKGRPRPRPAPREPSAGAAPAGDGAAARPPDTAIKLAGP